MRSASHSGHLTLEDAVAAAQRGMEPLEDEDLLHWSTPKIPKISRSPSARHRRSMAPSSLLQPTITKIMILLSFTGTHNLLATTLIILRSNPWRWRCDDGTSGVSRFLLSDFHTKSYPCS